MTKDPRLFEKGIFLDFDGTLSNSIDSLNKAYYTFLQYFGVKGSEDEFQSLNGPPLSEIISTLQKRYGLEDSLDQLTARYASLIQFAHQSAAPMPGASTLVSHAAECGWKVAVVTSSSRESVLAWLDHNGMTAKVHTIIGGNDVLQGKPSPDPYTLALAKTGCSAAQSLAVEDSRLGARSAITAGLSTYVIGATDKRDWPAKVTFISDLTDLLEVL